MPLDRRTEVLVEKQGVAFVSYDRETMMICHTSLLQVLRGCRAVAVGDVYHDTVSAMLLRQ